MSTKVERYNNSISIGKCPSHPFDDIVEGVRCQKCIDYYNDIKNNGMCQGHPNRPIVEGNNCCEDVVENKKRIHGEK